jgi:hypothetical protein
LFAKLIDDEQTPEKHENQHQKTSLAARKENDIRFSDNKIIFRPSQARWNEEEASERERWNL